MTPIEAEPYIGQLALLKHFPRGAQKKKALVGMFAKHASDADHAERIVTTLLEQNTDWPGPAAIREVAASTNPGVREARSSFESQMQQWKREFEENVKPWLCPECNGFGVVLAGGQFGEDGEYLGGGRYDVCQCPEGDTVWRDPATGKQCPAGRPGAVEWNGVEWMAKLRRSLEQGRIITPLQRRKRAE